MTERAQRRSASSVVRGLGTFTTFVFLLLVGWCWLAQAQPPAAPATPLSEAALQKRFVQDIWPLLTSPQASCVACHIKSNPSQLHFPGDVAGSYRMLVADGRLDAKNPSCLLARISAANPAERMPPQGMPGWTDAQKATLRAFMADLAKERQVSPAGPKADELFPAALLTPYHGPPAAPEGEDNTFLSYYQLKNKIHVLFDDDWARGGKDLFEENLAQFSGADFVHRFDESDRPTAAYLSAAGAMASDVAEKAYLTRRGPFANRPDVMPLPGKASDSAVRAQINRLYQRLLFRSPMPVEMKDSLTLLKSVALANATLANESDTLMFQLDARDENGQVTSQQVAIATVPARYGLSSFYVNENNPATQTQVLPHAYTLKPGDAGQHLVISNRGTSGHVSFQSLTLRGPLPATTTTAVTPDNPALQAEGAWRSEGDHAKDGYDDEDNNKGSSRLLIPLAVAKPGKYEISLTWRKRDDGGNAESVPVSVYSHDPSHLDLPAMPPAPPRGQAQFVMDETVDTVRYCDLQTAFEFSKTAKSGVEIGNKDTRRRVVADAVSYVPVAKPDGDPADIVKADDAMGHDDWPVFKPHDTIFNQTVGPNFHSDENKRKGELHLLFAPGKALPTGKYYRARITYPGEVDNETRVPVTVYAERSSPIVRLRAPAEAPLGAGVTLDASASYNVQHTPLKFTWTQIGGPRVALANPHAATLKFQAPRLQAQQAAWEGLCRALILHPDFLFTRPRSLATTRDPKTRRRLQLVKLAQDLVGRPPLPAEVARLDKGATLSAMVDSYLASPEFEDFYYRRVRLYLESHGTPTQDEPARLWRYILHKGLPYTEILTANYTITPDGKKEMRPAYCGHSGVLTMLGFIEGKPSLPHFNYSAQVCEKFLGYIFEVTPAIVKARGTQTAASTVDPKSMCYSCHQMLTPLAYQRSRWTDDGQYRVKDDSGAVIDDTDRHAVANYAFKGEGMAAFAQAAQKKERFHRTMIQTHFIWYFGREMRYDTDERGLYKRLWDETRRDHFALKPLIKAIVTSPEYLGDVKSPAPKSAPKAGAKMREARR